MKSRHVLTFACLALAIPGCGDGLARHAISGEIVVDGKPLPAGWIEFMPVGGNAPTVAASEIRGGQYRVTRSQGLVPSTYIVKITGAGPSRVLPLNELPSGIIPQPQEPIPARYNTESTLTAEVTDVGPNTFRFELVAKQKSDSK